MMKRIVCFCLTIFFLAPMKAMTAPQGPGGPPQVMVAPVGEADVVPADEYIGHVEAVESAELKAQVTGVVQRVHFQEGALVQQGDLLLTIEADLYQAQMQAVEAALNQAKAVLERRNADLKAALALVRVAQATIKKEEAELSRAETFLQRMKTVDSRGIIQSDIDEAESSALKAKAALGEAEAELIHRQAQVLQVESLQRGDAAAIVKAEADLLSARVRLAYTKIRAPITGRIGQVYTTKGNLVGPSSGPLAHIVQMDPVRVRYSISEKEIGPLFAGLKEPPGSPIASPRLQLTDGSIYGARGTVSFVDNQIDRSTGTISVWALFPNQDDGLVVGQYVTVLVKKSAPQLMPVVPQTAVLIGKEGRSVLTLNKEKIVTPRPITTGSVVGQMWAVTSGIKVGDEIIVSGLQKVRPGTPAVAVRVSEEATK